MCLYLAYMFDFIKNMQTKIFVVCSLYPLVNGVFKYFAMMLVRIVLKENIDEDIDYLAFTYIYIYKIKFYLKKWYFY